MDNTPTQTTATTTRKTNNDDDENYGSHPAVTVVYDDNYRLRLAPSEELAVHVHGGSQTFRCSEALFDGGCLLLEPQDSLCSLTKYRFEAFAFGIRMIPSLGCSEAPQMTFRSNGSISTWRRILVVYGQLELFRLRPNLA